MEEEYSFIKKSCEPALKKKKTFYNFDSVVNPHFGGKLSYKTPGFFCFAGAAL